MKLIKYILFLASLHLAVGVSFAQEFNSEEELKERAEELFEEGKYSEAMPLFSQLLSLYPNDAAYNYKFGTSLLYAEKDKEKPLKYLKYAAGRPNIDSKVHFHLGKCYHLNYQFDNAIKAYNKFREAASNKEQEEMKVNRHIEMCENGKRLLSSTKGLVVIQKRVLSEEDFFRAYDLDKRFGGRLIKKPDDFKSSQDKKSEEESVMFLEAYDADVVYYSSYGKKGDNGKDIYFRNRLPNGEWGKPISIGAPINTPYDEDYPFYDPQRQVMYFASKGHNSMGGYDIFKSYYNEDEGNFGAPVNLDFAISTPDDDILYVVDYEEKTAFFASRREASNGEMGVYQIRIERVPVNRSIIKGKFVAESTKAATITVKDKESGKVKGVFNTNPQNGNYLMNLPNGGQYEFIIERDGNPLAFTGIVDIPERDKTTPLKQELILKVDEEGTEMLVIKNMFDEKVEEDVVFSPEFFKQQASLDVNTDEYEEVLAEDTAKVVAENNTSHETESEAENEVEEISDISNEEVVSMAFNDADRLQQEADSSRQQADLVMSLASEKTKQAKEVQKVADEAWEEAENMEPGPEKDVAIKEATQMKKAAISSNKEAIFAYNLAKQLDEDASNKQTEAETALKIAEDVKTAINSDSPDESIEKLNELQTFIKDQKKASAVEAAYNSSKAKAELKRAEAEKQKQLSNELVVEIEKTQEEIEYLKEQREDTKDEGMKEELAMQVEDLEGALAETISEKNEAEKEYEKLTMEADALEQELAFVDNLETEVKSAKTGNLSDDEKAALEEEMAAIETSVSESEQDYFAQIESEETSTSEESTQTDIRQENESTEEILAEVENTKAEYESKFSETEFANSDLEKEGAKLEIHNETAQKAEALVTKLEAAKANADKKEKKQIDKAIKEAKELQEEQEELALESQNKLDELLAKEAELAENNTETKTEIVSDDQAEETAQPSKVTSDYTESFVSRVDETKQIDNQLERTIARAEVNEEWVEFIENEVADLKQASASQSGEEKTTTEERIRLLEELASEKSAETEQLYAQANALSDGEQVEELAYNNTAAKTNSSTESEEENVTEATTTAESNNDGYMGMYEEKSKQLENATDAGSLENELARAENYSNWASEIENEITELENQKETTDKKKEQKELQDRIDELSTLAKEKRALAQESQQYAEDLKEQQEQELAESNTTEPETNTSNYIDEFEAELSEAESIENDEKRVEKQIEINEKWMERMKLEKEAIQVQYNALEEGEEKQKAGERLAELDNLLAQKESEIKALESGRELASNESVLENSETQENNSTSEAETNNQQENNEAEIEVKESNTKESIIPTEKQTQNTGFEELLESKEAISNKTYADAEVARRDAESYQQQADEYRKQAEEAKKKKDREELLAEADKFQQSANIASAEAERLSSNAAAIRKAEEVALEETGQLKSEQQYQRTEKLEKEAQELQAKATEQKETAEAIKKKKDRVVALEEAEKTQQAANQKKIEAENSYALAQDMEDAEKLVLQRAEEQAVAQAELPAYTANLDEVEVAFVKNTDEFKDYAKNDLKAKKMYRQAQVYYEQAEEVENEANLQKELADNLRLSAENETDPEAKQEMIAKAEEFESASINKKSKADSLNSIGKTTEEQAQKYQRNAEDNLLALNQKVEKQFGEEVAETKTINLTEEENNQLAENVEEDRPESNSETEEEENVVAEENVLAENTSEEENNETEVVESSETEEKNTESNTNEIETNEAEENNIEESTESTNESIALNEDVQEAIDEVPETLEKEEIFQRTSTNTSVYSSSRPIPKVKKAPSGLVFKVQVGAFRNPIPQDLFKGFAPISSEELGDGITRYTAGYFKTFEKADKAKQDIRSVGYRDAFVVAYLNGKRISITEAREMIEEGTTSSDVVAENTNESDTETVSQPEDNSSENEENTTNETNIEETIAVEESTSESSSARTEPVQEVEKVAGAFYTIQVGVYSKQVNPDDLYNVQPLNVEKTESGLFRYTSGVYRTLEEANAAKDRIRSLGISDAFITAYNNGKRVTVAEAKTVIEGAQQESTTDNQTTKEEQPVEQEIEFRVQIGPYEAEVPIEDARVLLQMSSKGVKKLQDDEGNTVYTIGKFSSYDEVNDFKNQIVNEGIFSALEVAFSNGEKIDIEEAIELTE